MLGDGSSRIAHKRVGLASFCTNLHTLLCHLHQAFTLRRGPANDEHTAGIRKVSIQNRRAIHIDDVAFFQHFLLRGDTVTHHLIDARATALGEALIIEGCRNATMLRGEVIHQLVNLQRAHALTNLLSHQVQHSRVQHASLADTLYLFRSLDQITRRHQMSLVLEKQNPLVHLREWLSTLHVPVPWVFLYQSHFFSESLFTMQSYNLFPTHCVKNTTLLNYFQISFAQITFFYEFCSQKQPKHICR